jgi:hypothetical protein
MNTIASKAIASAGASVRALNPQLFGQLPPKDNPLVEVGKSKCTLLREVFAAEAGKRVRQSAKPLMNKLETDFFNEVVRYRWPKARAQSVKFRLGNGIVYTPDFVDFSVQPVRAFECKGPHAYRGGLENLKVAASLYPEVNWTLVWREKKEWQFQIILP